MISISHPVDTLRNSALGEKLTLEFIEQIDALEVFNARCLRAADNAHAAEIAKRYSKAITAGSDAAHLARNRPRLPYLTAVQRHPPSFSG